MAQAKEIISERKLPLACSLQPLANVCMSAPRWPSCNFATATSTSRKCKLIATQSPEIRNLAESEAEIAAGIDVIRIIREI